MKIKKEWGMSNKWTFSILPIRKFVENHVGVGMFIEGLWIDPFAGVHSPAQITNDINPKRNTTHHMDALEFLKSQLTGSYDGIIYDPPYSFRQVKECYEGLGAKNFANQTNMKYWSHVKNEAARILKTGGKALCFGWNSNGLGKSRGFEMTEILLVAHGGGKNDTICTCEIKKRSKD